MFIKSRIKSFMNHTLNHSLDHSLFHSLFVTTLRITYWSICWFQAWIMIWFEESWDESCEELHDILYEKPSLYKEWSFLKDFFSWFMWSNPRETADLVTLTERILNKKLHFFLCRTFLELSIGRLFLSNFKAPWFYHLLQQFHLIIIVFFFIIFWKSWNFSQKIFRHQVLH